MKGVTEASLSTVKKLRLREGCKLFTQLVGGEVEI